MHTTTGPSGRVYHHNGDFSGNVLAESVSVDTGDLEGWKTCGDVEIPFADMRHLVLQRYRSRLILLLEEADDDRLEMLLGIDHPDQP
jgi:hypothetical protein